MDLDRSVALLDSWNLEHLELGLVNPLDVGILLESWNFVNGRTACRLSDKLSRSDLAEMNLKSWNFGNCD